MTPTLLNVMALLGLSTDGVTWAVDPVVILFLKKSHLSMWVWIRSTGSPNIRMCEFRLEFLSYK
jgi:hypothetical protein